MQLKLSEAAFVTHSNEIKFRRMIKAGTLKAYAVRRGAKGWTYLIDSEALYGTPWFTVDESRMHTLLHNADPPVSRLDALETRVKALEDKVTPNTVYAPPAAPHALTLVQCGELAKAHGAGYWTARKEWYWPDGSRDNKGTAIQFIKDKAGTRFVRCHAADCPCQ